MYKSIKENIKLWLLWLYFLLCDEWDNWLTKIQDCTIISNLDWGSPTIECRDGLYLKNVNIFWDVSKKDTEEIDTILSKYKLKSI